MKIREGFIIIMILIVPLLNGCTLKNDNIVAVKESDNEKLSNESIDKAYKNKDIQEFVEKLNSKPSEIVNKLNEADSDTIRILKEVNEKSDELTDILNSGDFEGKNEEIKDKFDEISDDIDKLEDKANEAKERKESYDNPVSKEELTDTLDEFQVHMNNLEKSVDRVGNRLED